MTAASIALQVQARLIEDRRAETIAELRRHEAECITCGEGPADAKELRMTDPMPGWTTPLMTCRACFERCDRDDSFTDLPLVWRAIEDASR